MGGPIYIVDSNSIDGRLDTLEGESHENPLTFNDTSTINLVRSTDTITCNWWSSKWFITNHTRWR